MEKGFKLYLIVLLFVILSIFQILALSTETCVKIQESVKQKTITGVDSTFDNEGIISIEPSDIISILSPYSSNYDNNRLRLDIVTKEKCNLEYSDYVVKKDNWFNGGCDNPVFPERNFRQLCRKCYEYNKSLSFQNGIHYLTIRCSDKKDILSTAVFFVDGNTPKILDNSKKDNSFVNGNGFSVKYNENFVLSAGLEVREVCKNPDFCKKIDYYTSCELGKSQCDFYDLDLSQFNGKEVEYKYFIYNLGGKLAESNYYRAFVDTANPVIDSFSYSVDKNRALFNLDIKEDNIAKVEYIDYHSRNPVWKTICDLEQSTKCNPIIGISKGEHFFDIRVTDKAGNIGKYIKVSENNEAILGNSSAPITIIMFGDYENPETNLFFAEIYPQLKEKYFDKNRVNLVFRNYPNEYSEISMAESIAVECIRQLSGDESFWMMHNLILENQENMTEEKLIEFAKTINSTDILDCLEFRDTKNIVQNDINDGQTAGVFITPVFFINKEVIIGNEGFDVWKKVLNKEYSNCRSGNCA
jgi:protein-disulfide isomerase